MKKSILFFVLIWFISSVVGAADWTPLKWGNCVVPNLQEDWIRWFDQKPYGGIRLSWNQFATMSVKLRTNDDSTFIEGVFIVTIEEHERRERNKIIHSTCLRIGLYDGVVAKPLSEGREILAYIEDMPELWDTMIDWFCFKIKKDSGLKVH